jgi:hypothetical protein
MPALVRALNRVDLPTLGKPTMPHFKLMKISLKNQCPGGTSESKAGRVEVPEKPLELAPNALKRPTESSLASQLFVLVLSWE